VYLHLLEWYLVALICIAEQGLGAGDVEILTADHSDIQLECFVRAIVLQVQLVVAENKHIVCETSAIIESPLHLFEHPAFVL